LTCYLCQSFRFKIGS